MSKKTTKIMHEWRLVINLFWWLRIQNTFTTDSIPYNCVCIFKTFFKQYCIDYYIKRKKCSTFTEAYRVFQECQKQVSQHNSVTIMNRWNHDVYPTRMHLIFWRPCILSFQNFFPNFWTERFNFSRHLINICLLHSHFCSSIEFFLLVLAALSQNSSVHNATKNILSLGKHIHSVRRSTLLVFYLFIWASCKWKNSIILSIILLYFKCLPETMSYL